MPVFPRTVLGAAPIIFVGGCQQLPDVTYETEHAEIGTYFDAPLCAGNLARVDAKIRDLGLALDVPLESRFRIYWGAEGVETHCGFKEEDNTAVLSGGGCHQIGQNVIFVDAGSLGHELVHAVGDRVGAMEPFFEEGIAQALNNEYMGAEDFRVLPSSLVGLPRQDFESASSSRSTANHFVHFLMDERGMTPLNELRKLVHEHSSQDQVLAAFKGVYDVSMSDFETAWMARAPFTYDEGLVGPAPTDPWQGDDLVIRRTLACDDVFTHGPLEGVGVPAELHEQEGMYTTAAFDIVVPGFYDIGLTGDDGSAHLVTGACWAYSSGRPATTVIDLEAGASENVEMWACRWLVTLWVEDTNDTELTLTLQRTGDAP